MAYTNTNTERSIKNINGDVEVISVNVQNDETIGINTEVTKENTSGAGFASNVYGVKAYSKANSTETIVNIGGTWSKAEQIGSGRTYYITGATNRGYHSGSGDSDSVTASFSEAKISGTGAGNHSYLIGQNNVSKLDNANASVSFLQGMHCTVQLGDGDITGNMTALLLDADYTGTGTISGDFEYLSIMADENLPAVGGTARAIRSLSVLPSELAGSIQVAGLSDSAITEHADNASAIVAGLPIGTHYRTGDLLKIVH
jgi:hypothetical protein